ncbi:MAG TPA: hypothetical protein VFU28_24240 [Vicinamibacterales bacterium]|nr:hypothetical protein [Vicinamibacterales bacterium]
MRSPVSVHRHPILRREHEEREEDRFETHNHREKDEGKRVEGTDASDAGIEADPDSKENRVNRDR